MFYFIGRIACKSRVVHLPRSSTHCRDVLTERINLALLKLPDFDINFEKSNFTLGFSNDRHDKTRIDINNVNGDALLGFIVLPISLATGITMPRLRCCIEKDSEADLISVKNLPAEILFDQSAFFILAGLGRLFFSKRLENYHPQILQAVGNIQQMDIEDMLHA